MLVITLVDAPPGRRRVVVYLYQVLLPVVEETVGPSGHVGEPMGSSGNANGFWDIIHPR